MIGDWLREARHAVAFTGAGISTESGIPDFRSPGGIWSRSKPVYFQDFLRFPEARLEYWRQKCIAHADFAAARPNIGHSTLSEWEAAGLLAAVITQNIDGLHQMAGSRHVLELHGSARSVRCLDCGLSLEVDPLVLGFLQTQTVPDCPTCGGRLKHATISFGQALPEDVLEEAVQHAHQADLFLALGSSLVVEPAASLPMIAKENGARLVIVNRDPTTLDRVADLVIRDSIGAVLGEVARELNAA